MQSSQQFDYNSASPFHGDRQGSLNFTQIEPSPLRQCKRTSVQKRPPACRIGLAAESVQTNGTQGIASQYPRNRNLALFIFQANSIFYDILSSSIFKNSDIKFQILCGRRWAISCRPIAAWGGANECAGMRLTDLRERETMTLTTVLRLSVRVVAVRVTVCALLHTQEAKCPADLMQSPWSFAHKLKQQNCSERTLTIASDVHVKCQWRLHVRRFYLPPSETRVLSSHFSFLRTSFALKANSYDNNLSAFSATLCASSNFFCCQSRVDIVARLSQQKGQQIFGA